MKRFVWLLIVGLTVLLVACAEGEEVAVNTAVPTPPPTIEPTATETAVNFRLKVPDAQMLIQLRMDPEQIAYSSDNELNLEPLQLFHPDYNDSEQMGRWYRFIEGYNPLIEHDFQFYYPQEIPGAASYLFRHHELSDWPAHYLFGRGVIDFLNTYGHSLNVDREEVRKFIFDLYWYKGKVLLRSIPMQLDNDVENELLLLMHHTDTTVHPRFSAGAVIPVNITSQGYIQIIPNNISEAYDVGCEEMDITHDLNHDRQDDILFSCDWSGTGFSTSRQIVLGWNKEGVYRIGQTEPMAWDGPNRLYTIEVTDVDSDGFEEIVWRLPCEAEYGEQCDIVKTFFWEGFPADQQKSASVVFFSEEACEQIEDELCLNSLRKAILAQTDPAIPEKITQLLNYLPSDDPEAQPTIEHLTYLLGYFYELSGDKETAVSTYLDLIQRYPTSPWSWLAWARLEPVE